MQTRHAAGPSPAGKRWGPHDEAVGHGSGHESRSVAAPCIMLLSATAVGLSVRLRLRSNFAEGGPSEGGCKPNEWLLRLAHERICASHAVGGEGAGGGDGGREE